MLSGSEKSLIVGEFSLITLTVLQVRWREKDNRIRIRSVCKGMILVMNNQI